MGTPRYMSPEQCMGEELDGRSDIYSLGVVLYEMLCGIVPFTAATSTAVAVQQVTQAPPPLRQINSSVPPAVEAVVMRALEKKRDARAQTATALAQELNAAIHGRPLAQPNLTRPTGIPTSPVSTADNYQTMATMPSLSGNRERIPPNYLQNSASRAETKAPNRKRLLLLLVALVLIAGAGVAAFMLLSGRSESTAANPTETPTKSSNKPSPDNRNRAVAPVTTESPSTSSPLTREGADTLHTQLSADVQEAIANPEKKKAVYESLVKAQAEAPWDYRFTYERAKLAVYGMKNHDEAFSPLYHAAEIAIANGDADKMLQALETDAGEGRPLHKLSHGHTEWTTLINALTKKDASLVQKLS